MPVILVTGAASGIGKAFVSTYLQKGGNFVHAVDREFRTTLSQNGGHDTETLGFLDSYRHEVGASAKPGMLGVSEVDFADESQVEKLLQSRYDFNIDLVIHSAGVRGLVPSINIVDGGDVPKAETMDAMTVQTMQDTFNVNAIGTFLLLRNLRPKLRPGGNSKVIIMGSRMGSVGHNTVGGGYAYRASKAALNAVVKSFSVDVPEVTCVLVHPGRVESNLVGKGVKEDGAVTAEESVDDMLTLIERLGKEDSGRFIDRWGESIPW